MQKFTGLKVKKDGSKTSTGTVIARDEEEAKTGLLEQINPKFRENYEVVILSNEPIKMKSRLKAFVEQYGFMPQYGDYEATGWMDN